ncbi:hypothetical protein AeRB84_006749 [Aphanomyces euteiches]|nr:hypothetical protein AeRB84_006749 [Aphanomyces euteiches]
MLALRKRTALQAVRANRVHKRLLSNPASILEAGESVLRESSPSKKVSISLHAQDLWRHSRIPLAHASSWPSNLPDFPARPDLPKLYEPKDMPSEKVFPIPVAILHALAHIELGAIDNYWDTVVRFEPSPMNDSYTLPTDFYREFVDVACDECRHFDMVSTRLKELDTFYGALPAHRALLEHANNTRDSLAARLAVVPLVQEARGLDAGPRLVHKLKSIGDPISAEVVAQLVFEERGHVSSGIKWFKYLCDQIGKQPIPYFHELVRKFFLEGLPGPFNLEARLAAEMDEAWYIPLEMKKRHERNINEKAAEETCQVRNSTSDKVILIAGSVWPERTSSAAGVRTCDIIEMLQEEGWRVLCVSPSRLNDHTNRLIERGVECVQVDPNTDAFENVIKSSQLNIKAALFDRFIAEEMYGWQVAKLAPTAHRILDLQDLHFLRKLREHAVLKKKNDFRSTLESTIDVEPVMSTVLRELACIFRSNSTIYVSEFEKEMLVNRFGVSPNSLVAMDYVADASILNEPQLDFMDRKHVAFVGSFKHSPNVDGLHWMKDKLWPAIRSKLASDVELHIYGSYASAKDFQALSLASDNIRMMGFCENVHQTLSKYRVSVAPLRFGAGIKGKIIDSWMVGTPVVSTSVGAEGMHYGTNHWGGMVADSPEEFAESLATLNRTLPFKVL